METVICLKLVTLQNACESDACCLHAYFQPTQSPLMNMRLPVFLALLFLGQLAQGQDYHPMLREGVYWDVGEFSAIPVCGWLGAKRYFIDGDTTIAGKGYKKLYFYPFLSLSPNHFCPPLVIDTVRQLEEYYFMREDTVERQVFICEVNPFPIEYLTYDFGLSIGDTVVAYSGDPVHLFSIDSVQLQNGQFRRRFNFDDSSYLSYIESIGGSHGWFFPLAVSSGLGGSRIICVRENNEPIYGDECDYFFVDLEDPLSIPQLRISPNPATDQVLVEYPGREIHAQLWDMTGQVLDQQQGFDQLPVDLRRYPAGVYLLRVFDESNHLLASRKIIHSP